MHTVSHAKVKLVPLSKIIMAPQIRTSMEKEALQELAEDMRTNGVLQPVLVRPVNGGKYRLIAGHRRIAAAQLAGLPEAPALVRDADDGEALMMQLSENIHREDLSTKDLANAVRKLFDELGSLDAVAAFTMKSKAWCSKHLSLTLPDFSYHALELLELGISEDLELLGVVNQVAQLCSYDREPLTVMMAAIKDGKMDRSEARAYLKQLRAQISAQEELNAAKAKAAAARGKKPATFKPDTALRDAWFALKHDDGAHVTDILSEHTTEQLRDMHRILTLSYNDGKMVAALPTKHRWRRATRITRERPDHFQHDAFLIGLLGQPWPKLTAFLELVHESMHDRPTDRNAAPRDASPGPGTNRG